MPLKAVVVKFAILLRDLSKLSITENFYCLICLADSTKNINPRQVIQDCILVAAFRTTVLGFSTQRAGSDSRPPHVAFVADKVATGQVALRALQLSYV